MNKKILLLLLLMQMDSNNLFTNQLSAEYKKAEQYSALKNDIVNNPLAALKKMKQTRQSYNKEMSQVKQVHKKELLKGAANDDEFMLREMSLLLLDKYEQECPLFMLHECEVNDEKSADGSIIKQHLCLLNHTNNTYRLEYENKVVAELIKKVDESEGKPLSYVSFGGGGLFQDLRIITQFLDKRPNASLNIHLLEMEFGFYFFIKNMINEGLKVDPTVVLPVQTIMPQAINTIRKVPSDFENMSDQELSYILTRKFLFIERGLNQFTSWLNNSFVQARLNVYVHESTNDYIEYLDENKIAYPDIVTAADIEDDESIDWNSLSAYMYLCLKSSEKNSQSKNIWLSTINKKLEKLEADKKAHLLSIALHETPDSEKHELKLSNNIVRKLYITDTVL